MTRTGKIARLPGAVREELNRRLEDGESGVRLVDWLNSLPEAQKMLEREFEGHPINEPNLTEWRYGGFREWQARREMLTQARELALDAGEMTAAAGGKLTDHLAAVLATRYAIALAGWDGEVNEEFINKLRVLRPLCQDIVDLRRGDHAGARLILEKERMDREIAAITPEHNELHQGHPGE